MLELFVNPWLLGGLSLAAAPIIIHLLNRRRFEVHYWAAMDFLLQADSSNRRRVKFEDLLLLLLRIAVILALVLAICRPLIKGLAGWREDERVVVVDDSFSTAAAATAGSVFASIREGAVDQVQDAVGGGTAVRLWFGSRSLAEDVRVEGAIRGGVVADPEEATGDVSEDVRAALAGRNLLESVRTSKPVDGRLEFASIVRSLTEEADAEPEARVRSVVLLSDFRHSDWLTEDGELAPEPRVAFEEIERRELTDRLRFQFVDLGGPSSQNIAVTEVVALDTPILIGVPARLRVEVTNFGEEVLPRLEGSLEVGAPESTAFEPRQRIALPLFTDVPAGGTVGVEVVHVFENAGQYPIQVRIDNDLLAVDDVGHGVVVVREALRVLLVDGAPAAERFERESGYVATALAPRGEVPSGVTTVVVDGLVTEEALRDIDVIFALNRARWSPSEIDVLEASVARGGGIAWFLGGEVDVTAYSALAGPQDSREGGLRLFPATLRELPPTAEQSRAARLRFDDFEHSAFQLFRGLKKPSISEVVFSRYYDLDPVEGADVIATFDDDGRTPAIVELSQGGRAPAPSSSESAEDSRVLPGRLVLFNTTADRDWSDWPTDPSYPIVLQEQVRHLSRKRGSGHRIEVGEALVVSAEPGMNYRMLAADQQGEVFAEESVDDSGVLGALRFRPREAGLYRLIREPRAGVVVRSSEDDTKDTSASIEWFAFTRSPEESDLTAMDAGALEKALEGTGVRFAVGRSLEVDAFRNEQEGEIWRWLALAAGLFLVTELFVAWWFGRR